MKVGGDNDKKTFSVEVKDWDYNNKYIQSATLNGSPYTSSSISNEQIQNGGTLVLQMSKKPF
jgi:putative alpha-1,2-mannosidase